MSVSKTVAADAVVSFEKPEKQAACEPGAVQQESQNVEPLRWSRSSRSSQSERLGERERIASMRPFVGALARSTRRVTVASVELPFGETGATIQIFMRISNTYN